jgi:hypothetical protein
VDQTDISPVQTLGLILEPEEWQQVGAAVPREHGKNVKAVCLVRIVKLYPTNLNVSHEANISIFSRE